MAQMKTKEIQELNAYFLPEGFVIDELPNLSEDTLKKWKKAFDNDKFSALFHLGFLNKEKWFSPSIEFLHHIAEILIKNLSQQSEIEFYREKVQVELTDNELYQLKEEIPFAIGMEYVDDDWILNIWESLLAVFKLEIKNYDGTVARYFAEYNANINVVGRVFFHLVESKNEQYPFAFMATYSTKTVKSKRAVHTPLKNALSEFEGDEKKLISLISTVIKAAEKSSFISGLLESGELFSPLKLTAEEAYIVLKEIVIYEEAGIMCRVPDWWRKKSNSIGLSVKVGEREPSNVGLSAILDFSPSFNVGNEEITERELKEFLKMAEGLVQYKGKWVEINKNKLETVLKAFERVKELAEDEDLSLGDAMRLELNMNKLLDIPVLEIEVSVSNGNWLRKLRETMLHPGTNEKVSIVPSFHAKLREYQEKGYYWLNQMSQFGFGACLADDMGLGKTVQMIAFLEYHRVNNGGCALLILPASLIGNWQKEIEKFAPEMSYQILHKSDLKSSETIQYRDGKFLYITTYGMAVRLEELKNKQWDYLILDEAQAIKNPGTKQTKAIKAIPANMRIAMTGTPIENRLSDLWSLFDFLNQGLLGTAKEFTDFTKELKDNAIGYAKLRKMIQPFMLRRLKTDKSIIADLPDKMEMNEYTKLTKKQIALYKQIIGEIEVSVSNGKWLRNLRETMIHPG
ncbi:MAG: SNF2-related protein, partial [Sedimentibacter sp.]